LSTASPSGKARLRAAVGDTVVYAAHGVGRIVARERKQVDGTDREFVVVDLESGLRVTLPVADAADRLRPVADPGELEDIRRILGAEPGVRAEPWAKRMRETKAKLAAGRPTDLAEIVRDGGCSGRPARLSDGERRVYLQARTLLVRELCLARGVREDEVEAWIEAHIAASDSDGNGD
jgi:CarD family transcriptional regulator, regulator of rRNA transcription